MDQRWHRTPPAQQGPLDIKLRINGDIRGLVFGSYSEVSAGVSWLLGQAADVGVSRSRAASCMDVDLHADGVDAWCASITHSFLRSLDMTAARANSRLLLDRLQYVGRVAPAARRQAAHARRTVRALHLGSSGSRLWRLRRPAL